MRALALELVRLVCPLREGAGSEAVGRRSNRIETMTPSSSRRLCHKAFIKEIKLSP